MNLLIYDNISFIKTTNPRSNNFIADHRKHIVYLVLHIPRLRQDWESASRELGKLKDRHLEQAVKYSRALEEQGKASTRERDLLRQVGRLGTPYTKTETVYGMLYMEILLCFYVLFKLNYIKMVKKTVCFCHHSQVYKLTDLNRYRYLSFV